MQTVRSVPSTHHHLFISKVVSYVSIRLAAVIIYACWSMQGVVIYAHTISKPAPGPITAYRHRGSNVWPHCAWFISIRAFWNKYRIWCTLYLWRITILAIRTWTGNMLGSQRPWSANLYRLPDPFWVLIVWFSACMSSYRASGRARTIHVLLRTYWMHTCPFGLAHGYAELTKLKLLPRIRSCNFVAHAANNCFHAIAMNEHMETCRWHAMVMQLSCKVIFGHIYMVVKWSLISTVVIENWDL